ncbi:hypothetical protein [Tsukamurella sp. NPDC003166]|uniref:hypothetical protein n=1 Tax=Tsukamurella sp. NPDC003166 TaxID=3154444 RepID=UPI0033BF150D
MSAPQSPVGPPVTPPPGPVPPPVPPAPAVRWSGAQKLAFRFLFVIGGGILLLSLYGNVGLAIIWKFSGIWWLFAQIGSYAARGKGVDIVLTGGGDNLWQWCMHLGWIIVGVVIVAAWTVLDRKRPNYRSLLGLLGVLARFCLALSMIVYGLAKVIPTQMGFMALPSQQLQLTGDASLFTTLWGFMGASVPYMVATGLVELVAGVLLLWRRTALLGSLLAIVAMGQVFLLNLFYDVPVKIVSGELLVVAVALTAPYLPNLLRVVFNRPAPTPVPPLPVAGASRAWSRITGVVLKFAAAALMIVSLVATGAMTVYVIHTPRSDLDGIWRTTSFTIDGVPATLAQRDPAPWSNVAITLRGNDSNAVLTSLGEGYDSVVTQEPSGKTIAWQLVKKGDVLEMRKHEDDAPLLVTARLDGDRLHLSATVDGKRIEGVYERRFMERARSHFRLVQPDGGSSPDQGGS